MSKLAGNAWNEKLTLHSLELNYILMLDFVSVESRIAVMLVVSRR